MMDSIIEQLGIFFALSAVIAVFFLYVKQSTILAYILVGILLGIFKSQIHLEQEVIDVISEIGIILLLFLAGMELDLSNLRKKMKVTLLTGLGQIIIFSGFGFLLGLLLLKMDTIVGAIYFGLSITFSSTIVVIKLLKDRNEIDSFHGQTLIGVLIMQDITAIFAIVFLNSLNSEHSIVVSVLMILAKMVGVGLIMFIFSRYLINPIFKRFAQTPELLFIGSLGYIFGIAALCHAIDFSPEIGAFLAGVTLANIPYRIEIEDKVEPIKNLGVILFFVALGFNLNLNAELVRQIPAILVITLFVLIGTPIVMLLLGYIGKMKSRPVFFMGVMLNQISEFSLILASMCLAAGVFDSNTFTVITFASIISILLSSIGTSFLDKIYQMVKTRLLFIEKRSIRIEDQEELGLLKLKNHIVFLEYNYLVDMIADKFAEKEIHVIILDCNPSSIDYIEKQESKYHHAIYADPVDPDIWEELKLEDAALIISGIEENHQAEVALLNYIKKQNSDAVVVIHSNDYSQALELYENNASYVIVPKHDAAIRIIEIFEEYDFNFKKIALKKVSHIKSLNLAKSKFIG